MKTNKTYSTNKTGRFYKVYVRNVPRFTVWARSLTDARRLCENRVKGVSFTEVKYSKIVPLT